MTFDLTGKLLISTPAMADRRFAHSVLYLCAHGSEGAFGLVLNRPLPHLTLGDVLEQVGIAHSGALSGLPVLSGGPVEAQRGFVLHAVEGDGNPPGAIIPAEGAAMPGSPGESAAQALPGGLRLSASIDILRDIARGEGPREWLLALGYAGWGPGQLEAEIAQNAWLTAAAPRALIFERDPGEHQWNGALRSMGVDPASLSSVAGRA